MKDSLWTKIKYKYWSIVPHKYRPSEVYYFLKCFLWKHYNYVRIQTLPCTWNDRVEVLAHAVFQVLVDFVEKEGFLADLVERKNQHMIDDYTKAGDEIEFLYRWWKEYYLVDYPAKLKEIENKIKELGYPEDKWTPDESGEWYTWDHIFRDEEHERQYNQLRDEEHKLNENTEKELDKMLVRVLKVRNFMWL